jgi:hypothetical protein
MSDVFRGDDDMRLFWRLKSSSWVSRDMVTSFACMHTFSLMIGI